MDAFLHEAVRLTPFSRWLAMSRNGAPIGISGMFTRVTRQEISQLRAREWGALCVAAIACAKTNSNFAAQCDA